MSATVPVEGFRLSPLQRRLWLERGGGAVVRCAVAVDGELEVRRLAAALRAVIARHEAVRTAFLRLPGMEIPLQAAVAPAGPRLPVVDLRALGPAARDVRDMGDVGGVCDVDGEALRHGEVVRCTLWRSAAGSHLLLAVSALCADRQSLVQLIAELGAELSGEELDGEPTQYIDFAEWQNDLVDAPDSEEGREFWQA